MISEETLQQFLYRHRHDSNMLGSGASRVAFYCKKYNKVFKYELGWYQPSPTQSEMEYQVSQSLPEKYKKFLPVEQMTTVIYEHREIHVTVMPLLKVCGDDKQLCEAYYHSWAHDVIQFVADFYCLPHDMVSDFKDFIKAFKIRDVALKNIGLNGRTLVMVDAGIANGDS